MTLTFDMRVVAFCAGAALVIGVLFGIAPAWQATNMRASEAMGADSRTTVGGGGRMRNLLVTGEVATAVLLLFGAGLLLRTLVAVESYDRGYRAENVLTMLVDPLGSSYPTPERLQQFFDQVEAEVKTVPGVQDAAWSSALPLGTSLYGDFALTYSIVGDPPVPDSQRPTTNYQVVSPTYFSTLDLPIVEGRAFDSRDTRDSPRVCIVNEAFARSLGGRSPIGMQVSFTVADSPQDKPNVGEIVGVAKQVKGRPDEPKDFVQIYVPMAHDLSDDVILMVRAKTGRAGALTPAVRAAISRIDKEQLVSIRDVVTLEDVEWAATGRHRFRAVMVTVFADARGRARDGRRVRHPRVFSAAADARLRRAARVGRDDAGCRAARGWRRRARGRRRCGDGHRAVTTAEPVARVDALRCGSRWDPATFAAVDRGAGPDRDAFHCRAGVARDPNRSGTSAARRVS